MASTQISRRREEIDEARDLLGVELPQAFTFSRLNLLSDAIGSRQSGLTNWLCRDDEFANRTTVKDDEKSVEAVRELELPRSFSVTIGIGKPIVV
jgi:hypothetical protein